MTRRFAAFTAEKTDDGFRRGVTELGLDDLPDGDVLVDVEWSSVNYKDHWRRRRRGGWHGSRRSCPASTSPARCARARRRDRAGRRGARARLRPRGRRTTAATRRWRGSPSGWIVPLPDGLTAREAMLIGTAGLHRRPVGARAARPRHRARAGTVLVTGATGGVGSMAVAMLAGLGFTVAAEHRQGRRRAVPARSRCERDRPPRRADRHRASRSSRRAWAGAVDAVGGATLAHVLATLAPAARWRASGNVGGADLPTTVLPFILRGVTLYGIDSAQHAHRAAARGLGRASPPT